MMEDCFNLLDDDGDGLIDAYDDECTCGTQEPNLVPNGDFSETTGCCADLSDNNCLADWIVTGPSPDFVSDNCRNSDLRPDVRFMTDDFNESFNEGYVFSLIRQEGGRSFSESLGTCLDQKMELGKTYFLSFNITELRNERSDVSIAFYGLSSCDSLNSINTIPLNRNFCDEPDTDGVEQLASVKLDNLVDGWNNYNFVISPSQDNEAIFYSADCDNSVQERNEAWLILDNIIIRESLADTSFLYSSEIIISGGCNVPVEYAVDVDPQVNFQWYLDSMPIAGATSNILSLTGQETNLNRESVVSVFAFSPQGCRLIGPKEAGPFNVTHSQYQELCEGQTLQFGAHLIESNGLYLDTFPLANGCDSIVELEVNYIPIRNEFQNASLCPGDTILFGAQTITDTGTYRDTLASLEMCDRIIILEVLQSDLVELRLFDTACIGDGYAFGDQILFGEGIFRDTLPGVVACDTLLVLELFRIPGRNTVLSDTICRNQSYLFGGRELTEAGVYMDTTKRLNGCDSTILLELFVQKIDSAFIKDTICSGADYMFFGEILTVSGEYVTNVATSGRCDSIYMLDLLVKEPILGETIMETLPPGSFVEIGGRQYTLPGTYEIVLESSNGCDSLFTLIITDDLEEHLYIPNIFSPSSNGPNRQLTISAVGIEEIQTIRIYNRWGQLLFIRENVNSSDQAISWDGTFEGQPVQPGVYLYFVEYVGSENQLVRRTGDVMVID